MLDTEVTVALQGTLDTFALPDVLRLLASTKKVGRLRVTGDGGSGSLWVDGGSVVGSELLLRGAQADTLTEVLFNLMRFSHGSFTFEAGAAPSSTGQPRDVESIIVEAELMLGEWRSLVLIVPSLDAWLSLADELKGRDVVVDAPRWRIIVTIGSGATVGEVGRRVGLGDLAVMRAVKEVIELGLVDVDVAAPMEMPVPPAEVREEVSEVSEVSDELAVLQTDALIDVVADDDSAVLGLSDEPSNAGAVDVPVFSNGTPLAPPSIAEMRTGLGAMNLSDEPVRRPTVFDMPLDNPSEIARQLANLSPRAAKAVAAAAKATTDEEREAALATIESEDETINRGLLLKFLGAVDG